MAETLKTMNEALNKAQPALTALDRYWDGTQPAAYLSAGSREALGDKFRTLSVNYCRLAVTALEERLGLDGFVRHGESQADPELLDLWASQGLDDIASMAHIDALVYGRSYVTVWADAFGRPTVTVESPRNMTVRRDPLTREVVDAFKRWIDLDGTPRGVLYGRESIVHYVGKGKVVDASLFPVNGWTVSESLPNPLGVVPVVPLINRGRLAEAEGVSELSDLVDLSDALNKIMGDALVTSEFYAKPRRWVTGLEISEDDDGNPVDPFPNEGGKLWQSEDPDTKFGQFDGARLDGYADLVSLLTAQIGALSGLPPHYLGLNGDQPPSADSIRSAEASLVSRAYALQRTLSRSWGMVAALIYAISNEADPLAVNYRPVWRNPETRTGAQDADAAAKLSGIGVPLKVVLSDVLHWAPEQVEAAMSAKRQESVLSAGESIGALLP